MGQDGSSASVAQMRQLIRREGEEGGRKAGPTLHAIMARLHEIRDPEIGVPITDLNLIDDVKIADGEVHIKFHLTIPYCPPVFALTISAQMVEAVESLEGVREVKLELRDHYLAEQINRALGSRRRSK